MLPIYFDYIFVHQRQKVRLRSELSRKFLSTLGPNPARTRPEKPGPPYNSALLHPWINRFTMIIFARWLRKGSKFNGQKFE